MPRRRKYRPRYTYSVEVIIGETIQQGFGGRTSVPKFGTVACESPSEAMARYDLNPEKHKIIMTPRRGGIKRTIRPRVDRQEMLTLGFDELVQRIRYQAPWAEGDDTAHEHAIENALLLNIPARILLGIIRPHWLLTEKRELERVLNQTHRKWLEEKYSRQAYNNKQRDLIGERDDYMYGNAELRKAMQRVLEQSLAKDREIDELKAQLNARSQRR